MAAAAETVAVQPAPAFEEPGFEEPGGLPPLKEVAGRTAKALCPHVAFVAIVALEVKVPPEPHPSVLAVAILSLPSPPLPRAPPFCIPPLQALWLPWMMGLYPFPVILPLFFPPSFLSCVVGLVVFFHAPCVGPFPASHVLVSLLGFSSFSWWGGFLRPSSSSVCRAV